MNKNISYLYSFEERERERKKMQNERHTDIFVVMSVKESCCFFYNISNLFSKKEN